MDTTQSETDSSTQNQPPKKRYIRTFARDEATIKQGGVPDLVPFEEADSVSASVSAEPIAATTQTPQPTPVFRPQTSPVFPQPQARTIPDIASPTSGSVPEPSQQATTPPVQEPPPIERLSVVAPVVEEPPLQNSSGFFIPPPEVPPTPTYVPPPTPSPRPVSIETYSGDFSDKVEGENASPLTVLAAQQDAGIRPIQTGTSSGSSRTNILYVSAGLVLLIIASIGAYIAYQSYAHKTAPVAVTPVVPAPIFVDDREPVSGTGIDLLNAIVASVATPLPEGSVRLLYTTVGTTTDDNLFPELALPVPDIVLRNINPEGNMVGVINVNGSQSPFFILSVASYGDTLSGMLSWEPTMPDDLATLFPPYATSTEATSTDATSSPEVVPSAFVLQNAFVDETVANHNVRAYLDTYGQTVLLYGYWNQSTLVIARDAAAFTEILSRLANSEVQQ